MGQVALAQPCDVPNRAFAVVRHQLSGEFDHGLTKTERASPRTAFARAQGARQRRMPVCPSEYRPGSGQTDRPCGPWPTLIRASSRPVRVDIAYTSAL